MASPDPDPRSALRELPERIVFFDGVCNFCDGSVRWLMDRAPRLHFAPLQGDTAATVRACFPDRFPEDIDTIVYLRPNAHGAPEIALRSDAVFDILREVGGGWGMLAGLRVLPHALCEWAYRVLARNRYRWFGRMDDCRIPSAEERARSLA
jgi:predicted DCC family thiol-disulfide oxidoreductase YuxK